MKAISFQSAWLNRCMWRADTRVESSNEVRSMLWFLRLLGAPGDPDENMAWQYRHPARVAFAFACTSKDA